MNLAYIPSPSISEFSIGPLTIHFYALTMLAAIVVAVWIATVRWKKLGGISDQILDIALCAVPAGIIGARIYHIITTPERFFGPTGDWIDMFRIWNGGLGIWGAIVLGALAAWGWCRHRHYPMALLSDVIAPALLVAQAIGRLGNWFNQELYGAPTTLPWGLKLNITGTAIGSSELCYDGSSCPTGTLFQPTFLYEMIWNLIGAALILWIGRRASKALKAGSLFAIYVMWYTAGRTWIEMLRIDFAHEFLGVRINVWVSMVCFILGVFAFILIQRYGKSTALLSEKLRTITELESREQEGSTSTLSPKPSGTVEKRESFDADEFSHNSPDSDENDDARTGKESNEASSEKNKKA
ncbi:MAG: prolipoprotein diacylglyceryl transferase [Bifidobacterium aquikefiri]|uniref:Phosphatidylglycerol--prolipoprotein diacylglyceryl transferase n=1 Tax=Bifidobacterium aquikefiri TaxID=1653207 RepID=A0A261G710_9BIFI|nr:prolipoprotein diacylglyceryl transferase [Bifidobacterium aquikefiri]OZG66806.1 prolipoprotein diacylglyceryl transferase [Bifidobacterium aquikefiri]